MRGERNFRQFSLGETLCQTLGIFFGRLDVFLTLALGVTVPMSLTTILFVASLADVKSDQDVWDYFVDHLASCLSYLVFQSMLYVILFFTMQAAMVRAAAEILAGKSPDWYACFRHGFHKFGALVCARLLVWFFLASTLLLVVGLSAALVQSHSASALVVVLGICYLGVGFTVWMTMMVLYPVIVVENKTPTSAIRRSFALARGLRCYFFCALLILWITKLFVLGLLQGIFVDASNLSSLVSIAGVVVASATSLFSLPLTTILTTVMYVSARGRKEDFSRIDLLNDLRIEPANDNDDESNDERQVPLLADIEPEQPGAPPSTPPLVQDVIVVDDKEVPPDTPEASEVV